MNQDNLHLMIEVIVDALPPSMPEVYQHFQDDLPNECVGMVWADGEVTRLINQARSTERFAVSMTQTAEALASREGVVIAIYHSHPGGKANLSARDEMAMRGQWRRNIKIPWLVVTENDSRLWYPNGPALAYEPIENGLVQV